MTVKKRRQNEMQVNKSLMDELEMCRNEKKKLRNRDLTDMYKMIEEHKKIYERYMKVFWYPRSDTMRPSYECPNLC